MTTVDNICRILCHYRQYPHPGPNTQFADQFADHIPDSPSDAPPHTLPHLKWRGQLA